MGPFGILSDHFGITLGSLWITPHHVGSHMLLGTQHPGRSVDRPCSMEMMCPDGAGRESWEWEESMCEQNCSAPIGGSSPWLGRSLLSCERIGPLKMIVVVVECYCYYIYIIVEPPDLGQPRRWPFSHRKMTISDSTRAEFFIFPP